MVRPSFPLSDWQQKVQTLSGQLTRRPFIASGGDGR